MPPGENQGGKMMKLQEALLALEEPAARINGGINAISAMAIGLSSAKDPYADGLNAIWDYLQNANQDLQDRVKACLDQA